MSPLEPKRTSSQISALYRLTTDLFLSLSPATITYKVPDESDVEEIDSDDIDGAEGVAYARRVLRENHIRPAKDSLFLRSEIDLTVGDDEPPTLIIDEAVPTQRDTERTGTATKLPSNTFVDLTCSTNDDIALESSVPDMDTDEENFLQETHPQETQAIEDADVGEDDESSLDWAEHSSFYDESENSHQNEEPENHVPLTELPEPFQRFATDSIHGKHWSQTVLCTLANNVPVAVPYPAQSLQLPPIRNVPPPFEAQRQHADNLSWASQGQFRNMNMNIERNSGYAPVNPITSSYNTQPLLGVPLPPSPFCCGPAEFASRLEEAEHLEAGEQDKPVAQNMKGPYQSPYGGFEAHRAPSIPPCDNTDINRSFESPLVQSSFQLLHSPISPEHADPEPSEGPVLDETSAYHFELSKKASSQPPQEMASERQEMNANFDESTPALPPTAMSTKPLKRKAEEISQTTPEEEPGQAEEASSATAPSTNSSQVPTSLVTQSSCGSRTKDIRPIKRVRRAAEVFGFVALGGVAVMSALIATAPAL